MPMDARDGHNDEQYNTQLGISERFSLTVRVLCEFTRSHALQPPISMSAGHIQGSIYHLYVCRFTESIIAVQIKRV